MFTSRESFGVGDHLKSANDQSLLIVLIEDIVGVTNLDEIVKADHSEREGQREGAALLIGLAGLPPWREAGYR